MNPRELRRRWKEGSEIALFDAREEAAFAEGHPFFAVSLPLSRVEMSAYRLAPRLSAPVVVYDGGKDDEGKDEEGPGLAERVAGRLLAMGYSDVSLLDGGLESYVQAGGELFRDVNVPSKAFGELVEAECHTPSLPAEEVRRLIEAKADMVVLDVRRFSEYQTMSIPGGISVPGAEIALRVQELAPRPETLVVVNCAGRTRSIIGAQSLVNAGIPNRVAALRNGTIGWKLAGLGLEHGQSRSYRPTAAASQAVEAATRCALRSGVREIGRDELLRFRADSDLRTLYCLDVRSEAEYRAGHPAGFVWAQGGQLVQATDEWVAVRGARIVLFDDDGVRARMTGSWLAQMGWDVSVMAARSLATDETGMPPERRPPLPDFVSVSPVALAEARDAVVVDLAPSPDYRRGHIPGAHFLIRSRFGQDAPNLPAGPIVLTSPDGDLAFHAAFELQQATGRPVAALSGGTRAWADNGYPLKSDDCRFISPPVDVYKRPYEGTDSTPDAMRAYIEWEFGLIAQVKRDGVAGFNVLRP